MPKPIENGFEGRNRAAVAATVAKLDADGLLGDFDQMLIAHAETLAEAADRDPANSQIQMQLGNALERLRREVMRDEDRRTAEVMWSIDTGCMDAAPEFGRPPAHRQYRTAFCVDCVRLAFVELTGREWLPDEVSEFVHRQSPAFVSTEEHWAKHAVDARVREEYQAIVDERGW